MQGELAIIDLLNDVLTAELTSVNQYFADSKMSRELGLRTVGREVPRGVHR